MKDPVLAKLA